MQETQDVTSSHSFASIDDSRFAPGTLLGARYRMVGLLGRGGMGEVYRADDLKLRHPVALKFLPKALTKDAARLERFHHEVRIARHVSHPNVCRVYDITEVDGQHFLSMEYVDGEDLSTILKRFGRPSKDKALQIARQLCAGLAAAHDKGVLHRDMKPHNVMIDGKGTVRITDFGLAGFAQDFSGQELTAGTPAYMAPEQLAGREVSVKSDIYSLGLVLFELFTGQRAFEHATSADLQQSRASITPTSLSNIVEDIDPAVERVILRCLEPDPVTRPSSALAVAAALPGGDPLAAALAAGETPSPEMVADAGEVGGLRPAIAVPCLAALLVGMILMLLMRNRLYHYVSMPKPPEVLANRAQEILKRLGHDAPPTDLASGFHSDEGYLDHISDTDQSPSRWDQLRNLRPPAIHFWYRQSPRILDPHPTQSRVSPDSPPLDVSGMANVELDPQGRLFKLEVAPPQREDDSSEDPVSSTDWSALFAEAQLEMDHFKRTEPRWTPRMYCDQRAAWIGSYPDQDDLEIRIEAGSYRSKPTFFKIIAPWTRPGRMEEQLMRPGQWAIGIMQLCIFLSMLVASLLIARRNLKLRRGDRGGANRLALTYFAVTLASWMLTIQHIPDPWPETFRLVIMTSWAMSAAATLWLLYIALEPFVRRHWPQVLISWSRLLAGRLRDPLVGRDILLGGLFCVIAGLCHDASRLVGRWVGAALPVPSMRNTYLFFGGRYVLGQLIDPGFMWFALFLLFMFFVFRLLFRKEWIAGGVMATLLALPEVVRATGTMRWITLVCNIIMGLLLLILMIRFGLLALVSGMFIANLLTDFPVTTDLSRWYAGSMLLALAVAVIVAVYGFHTALAGRALFRDELLET